MDLIDC